VRRSGLEDEYLCSWEGYDQVYDSWVKARDVGRGLVASFNSGRDVIVDFEDALYDLRDAVAGAVIKLRRPEGSLEVMVPSCAFGALASALLRRCARPPSRAGKKSLRITVTKKGSRQTSEVELQELNDLAWLLQLHVVRPEKAFGCVVFKKGRGSQHDMLICGPPFVISYAALVLT
jgi:hypothetical protein